MGFSCVYLLTWNQFLNGATLHGTILVPCGFQFSLGLVRIYLYFQAKGWSDLSFNLQLYMKTKLKVQSSTWGGDFSVISLSKDIKLVSMLINHRICNNFSSHIYLVLQLLRFELPPSGQPYFLNGNGTVKVLNCNECLYRLLVNAASCSLVPQMTWRSLFGPLVLNLRDGVAGM